MYFETEKDILKKIIYKSKNQHKRTLIFKKMVHLHKLCKDLSISSKEIENKKALKCCEDLYIMASSNIKMGHFIGYTLIILGLSSRIHFFITKNMLNKKCEDFKDEIDEIFENI